MAAFTLDGRPMRGVRQAVNRVERAGLTATVRRTRDVPAAELAELIAAAAAWRGGAVERGFSMALSRIGDPADGDCVWSPPGGRTGAARAAALRAVGRTGCRWT